MVQATASQLIDEILESLGIWGKYQILQIIVVFTLTWPSSNQLYSIIYMGYQPPLRCHHPVNSSLYSNDSETRPYFDTCKELFESESGNLTSCPYGYDYEIPKDASFTSEWDLVCGESYQAQLAQTALVIGQAVGATLFTAMADKFGRMKACIVSQWGMLVISTISIFASSPVMYTVLKFLTGVAQQGHVTAFFVMPLEVLPTRMRTAPHVINSNIWSTFLCVQVAVAYFLRDVSWRWHQVAMTIASVVTLVPNMLWLDESIRWLFANERIDRVRKIIDKATKMNKADPVEVEAKTKACILETAGELHTRESEFDTISERVDKDKPKEPEKDEDDTQNETEAEHKGTLKDIMKNRRLRTTTFIMFFCWIVNSLTSFGLSLTASKLSGNRFLNYFLVAVVPLPAGIVSYYTLIKWGRKTTSIIFHAMAGVFLIAAVLLDTFMRDSVSEVVVAFTMIGRFAISASWNTLFLYTPELYPTNLRSLGLGISSSSSRIGGMLAPFSNIVIDYIPWLPGTIYGCSCIVVCFLMLYLPETLNRELPQTLDEIKEWNKIDKEKKKLKKLNKKNKNKDVESNGGQINGDIMAEKTEHTKL